MPEEATRVNLPIKGKIKSEPGGGGEGTGPELTCPMCGNPVSQCTCGEDIDLVPGREPLCGSGVPQQAFQHLLDLCHDRRISHLSTLRVTVQGDGAGGARNLRTLGLVIPQLGKGEFRVEQRYSAEFGDEQYLSIGGSLGWSLYRRLKQVTDALAQEATKFITTTTLVACYPDGLAVQGDRFRTVHEVMTTVGLGTLELEAQELENTDA